MSDGTGLAEQLLGLDGFKVLDVTEGEHELVIAVETTASVTGCWSCGVLAECQDRVRVDIRDLACFGRPARVVWSKRRIHRESERALRLDGCLGQAHPLRGRPAFSGQSHWRPCTICPSHTTIGGAYHIPLVSVGHAVSAGRTRDRLQRSCALRQFVTS